MDEHDAKERLIEVLRLACSGELAAAYAYRGHWRSLSRPAERTEVRHIEAQELEHRARISEMLAELGLGADPVREARAALVGRLLGVLCFLAGWLLPMYGAGRLERRNIGEYELAARHAWSSGRREWVEDLLTMAEVEWDHEQYFRKKVLSHPVGRRLPLWPSPPPRAEIRAAFERDRDAAAVRSSAAELPFVRREPSSAVIRTRQEAALHRRA